MVGNLGVKNVCLLQLHKFIFYGYDSKSSITELDRGDKAEGSDEPRARRGGRRLLGEDTGSIAT